MKANPKTSRIMVLMVTALNELGDIERAVAAGTDDFLSKPVTKPELLKRVQNMLRLKDILDENERLRRYIQEMDEAADAGDRRIGLLVIHRLVSRDREIREPHKGGIVGARRYDPVCLRRTVEELCALPTVGSGSRWP